MRKLTVALLAGATLALTAAVPALASHSWSNYHWARTANPFTVKVNDSMTADWDDNLDLAISDWNRSTVLDVVEVAASDSTRTRKQCRAVSGQVRSCNAEYGFNGWLGLATISVSGSHITQGTAKMNDSYFNNGSYTEVNRQHVVCQEIGHDWGLGHQDESGADLNTCMDYADALDNPSPNQHDYDQLVTIYGSHLDSTNTATGIEVGQAGMDNASPVATERIDYIHSSVITHRFADGTARVTHILWALGAPRAEHGHDH